MSNNIIKRVLHANLSIEAIRIKNTTSTFGIIYPDGTIIFDESTTLLYLCIDTVKPYDTLFSLIENDKVILLTPTGGIGNIHNVLADRNVNDCHPVTSITGLEDIIINILNNLSFDPTS